MSLDELIKQGNSAARAKQWELAIEHYSTACQTYAEDNDGEENPDILYKYGHALFQFARTQANLLNTENVDKSTKPMDNIATGLGRLPDVGGQPEDEEETDEPEEPKEESEPAHLEVEQKAEPETKPKEVEASNDKEDIEEPAEESEQVQEEDDDFTVAWQMIDLCRVLYGRQLEIAKDKRPIEIKIANVYSLLGEISIDDDNFEQAAVDLKSALELKEKLYEPNTRLLSEANYLLAVAYEFKSDLIEDKKFALDHLKKAVTIAKKSGVDNLAIQDLRQKVHDLGKEIESLKDQPAAPSVDPTSMASVVSAITEAQDISTLVKKRKKSESGEGDESSAKQKKL